MAEKELKPRPIETLSDYPHPDVDEKYIYHGQPRDEAFYCQLAEAIIRLQPQMEPAPPIFDHALIRRHEHNQSGTNLPSHVAKSSLWQQIKSYFQN